MCSSCVFFWFDGFIVVICLCNVGIIIKFWTWLKRCPRHCLYKLATNLFIFTSNFALGIDHLVFNSNFPLDKNLLLFNSSFCLGHLQVIVKIKKQTTFNLYAPNTSFQQIIDYLAILLIRVSWNYFTNNITFFVTTTPKFIYYIIIIIIIII